MGIKKDKEKEKVEEKEKTKENKAEEKKLFLEDGAMYLHILSHFTNVKTEIQSDWWAYICAKSDCSWS